jgi:hypothetical protein
MPADPQTLLTPRATSHRTLRPTDPEPPQTHRPLRHTDNRPTDPQTHRPPDHREGTAECAERLNPPPPAWQGSRACGTGGRLHQMSSEFELRQAPRIPPSPPSWPGPGPSPLPKMQSSSLRWPSRCRPGA